MSAVKRNIGDFWKCERGVTSIEYSLIAGGVAVSIIASLGLVGGKLSASLATVADAVGGEPPQPPPADPPMERMHTNGG